MSKADHFGILDKMSEDIFKKFEGQLGKEWGCSCGSSFESDWVEVVSQTKKSLLARYTCQICGREQMFAVSITADLGLTDTPTIEIPRGVMSSDDVLDIRSEVEGASFSQIRNMGKRTAKTHAPTPKITRR